MIDFKVYDSMILLTYKINLKELIQFEVKKL